MTYTVRVKNTEIVGICKVLFVRQKVYVFEYLYNESHPGGALDEAAQFYKGIRFPTIVIGQFTDSERNLKTGFVVVSILLLGGLGIIFLAIYLVTKKRGRVA